MAEELTPARQPPAERLDGRMDGLSVDGRPLTRLYLGWQTVSRHPVTDELDAVVMREKGTEREVCWWVDPDGAHQASHVMALPAAQRTRLLDRLARYFGPLTEQTLAATPKAPQESDAQPAPETRELAQRLAALPRFVLLELLTLWTERILEGTLIAPTAEVLAPDRSDDTSGAENHGDGAEQPFSPVRLHALLQLPRPVTDDEAIAASPFTGLPLHAQIVMNMPEGTAARFCDPTDDLVFYLFWPSYGGVPFLYYPKGPLLIGEGPQTSLVAPLLLSWLVTHPEVCDRLPQVSSLRVEDFGVGHAASLWDETEAATPSGDRREASSAQNSNPVHFSSSPHWGEWFKNVAEASAGPHPKEAVEDEGERHEHEKD
ncbi:hypothetical protein E3E11_04735 [Oecophyllibacter saccharovorans]|uniref:hypothetical protein n=1 Tax=Oecophyllibacter saccharovorans TaxID=2558360 RepID=UPI001144DB77|nr:hypothetical protein [Oecophyllibacter saccharovorans]QDH15268.1 hypothetical protein E3E11_04735 [Oecophyllibacter saccharovorans]